MFSGLVETVGLIRSVTELSESRQFEIDAPALMDDLEPGASVAIDGICLTATHVGPDWFRVQAVAATLSRTTAGDWQQGRPVNLERALRVGDRIGGHFVQGHVDAVGTVLAIEPAGEQILIELALPDQVAAVTVLHGSLTVDGVSLTVSDLDDDVAQVAIIPFTWQHTNLPRLQEGSEVNLEGDLIGKFVVAQFTRLHV